MRGRRILVWVLVAAAVLAVGALTGNRSGGDDPLDPRSGRPLGTLALVRLLDRFGGEVLVRPGAPPPAAETALLLDDRLGDQERARTLDWVRDGGVLVVADPASELAPLVHRGGGGLFDEAPSSGAELMPHCDLAALSGLRGIRPPAPLGYEVQAGDVACFPLGDAAYLVAWAEGEGAIVALGGAGVFVNSRIDEADNAALAVALLAPTADTDVAVLEAVAGTGDEGLLDLVSPRVTTALWQLAAAFAVFALWKARRLGRPVPDRMPVAIPGAELVVAVGNLLQQARRREQAAGMLRLSLRRVLADRLGLAADASPDRLAAAASARAGLDAGRVAAALAGPPPADDVALVELAATIDTIRTEVTHA